MVNSEFDKFVKRQQQLAEEAENQVPFDPAKEIEDWRNRLVELFSQVKEFLKDYINAGTIYTVLENIELTEEFSGLYTVQKMIIQIGIEKIELKPIGTMLIGSKGRVDVIGRAGISQLVLLNKKFTSPSQMVTVRIVDPRNPQLEKDHKPQDIEWVWKIISRPPPMRFIDLNKESFMELLLEVSNG